MTETREQKRVTRLYSEANEALLELDQQLAIGELTPEEHDRKARALYRKLKAATKRRRK